MDSSKKPIKAEVKEEEEDIDLAFVAPALLPAVEFAIKAEDAAQAEAKGVVTVDGRMIENLHVAMAQRTLAIADAIAR